MNRTNENSWGFLAWLVTGAALGAGIAILFAPKPGRKLRDDLSDSATDLTRRAADQFSRARDTLSDAIRHGRSLADRAGHAFAHACDKAAKKGEELSDRAREVAAWGVL